MSPLKAREEALASTDKRIDCIYSDGSFVPSTGGGGWAIVVFYKDGSQAEIADSLPNENSLRMELHAVIRALRLIRNTRQTHRITIFVDCQIIVDWCHNLRSKLPWRRSSRASIGNADLWEMIHELQSGSVRFTKVRAHQSKNKQCDRLARNFALKCQKTA